VVQRPFETTGIKRSKLILKNRICLNMWKIISTLSSSLTLMKIKMRF